MKTKKQKLQEVREYLSANVSYPNGFVKNVGKIFFMKYHYGCVMRDLVYYNSLRYDLDFELLALDWHLFVGTKAHAKALKEAFGGTVSRTEYCDWPENARELYIWQIAHRQGSCMDLDEAIEAIFS